jgi:hypothetical protein
MTSGHELHEVRDRNSSELIIAFVPTDIFMNKILVVIKGMIQVCLAIAVYSII